MKLNRIGVLAGVLAAVSLQQSASAADAAQPLVLTGTQAAYSLTVALTAGTPIQVQNVPADGRQLALLKDYIERRMDSLAPTFASATAVVSRSEERRVGKECRSEGVA